MLINLIAAISIFVSSTHALAAINAGRPSSTPVKSKSASSSPAARVIISPFKILDDQKRVQFQMDAKGRVKFSGGSVAKMSNTGVVSDLNGKILAKLNKDYRLIDSKGEMLTTVLPNGLLDNGEGKQFYWHKDGAFSASKAIRLVPPDSPSRQAASILLFLYFSIEDTVITEVTEP